MGYRYHRTPHQRGQGVLRGRNGHFPAPGGRLVDRLQPDRSSGPPTRLAWPSSTAIPRPVLLRPIRNHAPQFTSWAFTDRAKQSGLVPSMGSIGDCYHNVMIESFWARMQTELLNRKKWVHGSRVGQCNLRVPGDRPQPPTASLRTRDAHTRIDRTATPIRPNRGLKPTMATPPDKGHIRVSGNAGTRHPALGRSPRHQRLDPGPLPAAETHSRDTPGRLPSTTPKG